MTSEWDDTPWGGTVPTYTNVVRMMPSKAATGWQGIYTPDRLPISATTRSPLRRMREEQALYWSHPWVRVAESTVTRKVAGLPWHLEDGASDEEVDDATSSPLQAVQTLLEKPQAALDRNLRQPGITSWKNLVKITSRHIGLCGMTHWLPDQPDGDGIPLAILYINPARLMPVSTTSGQVVGWSLDPKDDNRWETGTLLRRDEVLTFYLDPPDYGGITSGLVQAAWLKAQITIKGDTHYLASLGSGGALSGIVSPKEGTIQPEQYGVLVNELRNIQEQPDSSRRLAVASGPVDYQRTQATSQELDLPDYSAMTRSDILTVWGVPDSQTGIPAPAGLNSGGSKEADEPVLMQGAVHDRVDIIRETVQTGFLDRWAATGISPQLVIEEPTFDDRTPAFNLGTLAKDLPLTRNQRLALVGEDPLPEYGPDGAALGLAIDLPIGLSVVGQGEEPETMRPGRFTLAPQAPSIRIFPNPPLELPAEASPAKARGLSRDAVIRRFEPAVRKAVAGFLAEQRQAVAARVRDKGEAIARKPKDASAWWPESAKWDERLLAAVKRSLGGIAETVATKVAATLPAKADPFVDSIVTALIRSVARRVTGINATTRDAISAAIGQGFADGLSPGQVADLIADLPAFDDARAELVARTESALAYNEAAVQSYREHGVSRVEVIDGDEDEICASANGQVWTLDEANADPIGHPNCVRDFSPVFA